MIAFINYIKEFEDILVVVNSLQQTKRRQEMLRYALWLIMYKPEKQESDVKNFWIILCNIYYKCEAKMSKHFSFALNNRANVV